MLQCPSRQKGYPGMSGPITIKDFPGRRVDAFLKETGRLPGEITFEQIERALDAGKLEMVRPWGDWVKVRRRGRTVKAGGYVRTEVFMENQVEACVSSYAAKFDYPGIMAQTPQAI